jgi:hypothetical protein
MKTSAKDRKAAHFDVGMVMLSSTVSVARYRELEQTRQRASIARFVEQRFRERYIIPVSCEGTHGFSILANCCLMIEALESFYQGWENTELMSRQAFESFFKREPRFQVFQPRCDDFYYDVRCGILHHAETKGGWRIGDSGPLLDEESLTINAVEFLRQLGICLAAYTEILCNQAWDTDEWVRFRKKMDHVIEHCRRSSHG